MPSHETQRDWRRFERAVPWLLVLLGLLVTFRPVLASGFRSLQIYFGDPRLVNYVLEHTYRWVGGDPLHSSFWSPPIFHPAPGTGAYTDTMVGVGPIYWCFRTLGLDGGLSMQAWIISVFALNFLGAQLLFRCAFSLRPAAAGAGAFLFAFASSKLANFNSPQLFPVFPALFALLALQRIAHATGERRRRRAWILLFFACLSLQAWSTFYPTFFLVLGLCAALVVALSSASTRATCVSLIRADLAVWGLAAVLALASIWPLAQGHLAGAAEVGWRTYELTYKNLPTPASWIFPGRTNLVYGGLYGLGPFAFEKTPSSQHSNGLGLVTTAVCVLGLWRVRKRPWVRVLLLSTLLLLLLSTRWPGGASGWRLIYEVVPGAKAIRYPARIGQFLAIPLGLGLAAFVERSLINRRLLPGVALLLVAVFVEQLHDVKAYDEEAFRTAVQSVAASVDPAADSFYVSKIRAGGKRRARDGFEDGDEASGFSDPPRLVHLVAMWAGLAAGKPTLNGFYGNHPPRWSLMHGEEGQVLRWANENGLDPRRISWLELSSSWHPRSHPEVEVRSRSVSGRPPSPQSSSGSSSPK